MGNKQQVSTLASTIANGAPGYAKGKNARSQLDFLVKIVMEKNTYFRKYELRAKTKRLEEWDILKKQSPRPTGVVLLGADGGMSHSVTIVDNLVFDSNSIYAMHLNKETLPDWCCNCMDGHVRASYAVRFWN
jgi:hypothetical protein